MWGGFNESGDLPGGGVGHGGQVPDVSPGEPHQLQDVLRPGELGRLVF